MSDHTPKAPQKEAASSTESLGGDLVGPQTAFADSRPEAIAQRKLQAELGKSPQVQQAAQLQAHANQSPQVQQLTQLQAVAKKPAVAAQAPSSRGRSGLPEDLQASMEELSGMDMSDVQVHYNSAKPAQLQAHAFAQGSDIHLGPGQEQHLAHEAWHVVQQRQGRVQATRQLKGTALNDDSALEREADLMGAKAMQLRGESAQVAQPSAKSPQAKPLQKKAATAGIAQRIVTSLTMKTEERITDEETKKVDVISNLNIIGRPENTFSGSAGDHTTAFAVHCKGLAQQLKSCTLAEAATLLQTTLKAAQKLPGYSLIDDLPEKHAKRLQTAEDELSKLLLEDYSTETAKALSDLQQAINLYFEFRELIPLSTINIGKISKSSAGKGKGESAYVSILEQHAGGSKHSSKDRLASIVRLFDTSSLGLAVIQQNSSLLKDVIPGLQAIDDISKRMDMAVLQHFESIEMSFPKALEGLKAGEVKKKLKEKLLAESRERMVATVSERSDENQKASKRIQKLKEQSKSEKRKSEKKKLAKSISKDEEYIQKNDDVITTMHDQYEKLYGKKMDSYEIEYGVLISDEDQIEKPSKKRKGEEEEEDDEKLDLIEDDETDTVIQEDHEDEETKEKKSPLGIQLVIDKSDQIQGIEMAGRSPSPKSVSGMGAHTIAWVVHVDHVIQALKGKTLDKALETMDKKLVVEAKKLWKEREKKSFEFNTENHEKGTMGEDQKIFIDAEKKLDQMAGWKKEMSSLSKMMHLQSYINALLTYINFIPGSTMDSSNTNGNAEGKKRATLLNFENGEKEYLSELKFAIEGMLDVKEGLSGNQIKLLKSQHKKIIQSTYPKVYEAVFESMHTQDIRAEDKKSKKKTQTRKKKLKDKE